LSYLPVPGGKLYYETAGEGSPLVLIHAGFLDSRMWDDQFQLFAKSARVIRYDVRGFGRSSRPSEEYSDAEDLFALLNHLRIENTSILGNSNGGRIALDFVSVHPTMVNSLILVSPGIRGYKSSGPEEDREWEELGKKGDVQDLAISENRIDDAVNMDLEIWAPAQGGTSKTRILEIATANSHIHKNPPNKLQRSPQPPAFTKLNQIRIPTILIVGDWDVKGMQLMAKRLHELIPGSKLRVIKGADHIANTSRPEEFNAIVTSFLEQLSQEPLASSPAEP
jgi:pimeloyl-ACP methyl ester carboxylesterase